MIKIRTFNILIFLFISITSCTDVKEGLSPNKRQGDEFLVEKKNPLVLPPNYTELPVPRGKQKKNITDDGNSDIKKIIGLDNSTDITTSKSSLEKSILEKINEN